MTREEKIDSLSSWCARHPCSTLDCRIFDICHQHPGDFTTQPDEVIDKIYEALWEGEDLKKEEAENRLQQAEEQLGFKFTMPLAGEVAKIIRKNQQAKADAGKAPISLVPMEIVWAIAWIRKYGNEKYGDPDNWKTVEPERYRDALMRHLLHYISDPKSVDEESGYPHLWHAACNMAFLMHMDYGEEVLHGIWQRS